METLFFRRNLKSLHNFKVSFMNIKETLKKFLKDLRFRRKNKVPIFESTEKIFFEKVGKKNPNIKVEAKFACGSNGSILGFWKSL